MTDATNKIAGKGKLGADESPKRSSRALTLTLTLTLTYTLTQPRA